MGLSVWRRVVTLTPDFEELLQFWFPHDLDDPAALRERATIWFGREASFDQHLEDRFSALPDRAAEQHGASATLDGRAMVSLVIALDQLPRNLYRESPRAFQYDALAQELASRIVQKQLDEEMHPIVAVFVYLPFEHAEDLACQERSVAGFRRLLTRASTPQRAQFEQFLQYAERHKAVIDEFGRFPHRNGVLNRRATQAEIAYLDSGGDTFG